MKLLDKTPFTKRQLAPGSGERTLPRGTALKLAGIIFAAVLAAGILGTVAYTLASL